MGQVSLPDGSAFAIASFPLPKAHWLYAPREYATGAGGPLELPTPILTHGQREAVVAAIRYAVRGATMCGREQDFDPDAMVQNAVYALCGPYAGVSAENTQTSVNLTLSQQPATPEPVAWLDEMLADTREVFDAGGSETPQVVRDVIEYVKSWVTVYSEKNYPAPAAHPAPSVPATSEPVVSRNPFASRCYTMSESHLSGHRLIVGFEKPGDVQDAHEWVARQGRGDFTHPAPSAPGDDFDLICNAIDKADTITMEGDYMLDSDDCIAVVRVMQVLLSVRAAMLAAKERS